MVPVLYLLIVLSIIGSADTIYFHILKGRLYRHHACRWEVLTHVGHGLSAAGVYLLCATEAHGRWAWLTLGVFGFQLVNQVVDLMIEPHVRRDLGGVPHGEYRMHGVINVLWGGIMTLGALDAYRCMALPDSLAMRLPDVPVLLQPAPFLGALGALGFATFDFVSFVRLMLSTPATSSPSAQPA